jgi:hypothetical protein
MYSVLLHPKFSFGPVTPHHGKIFLRHSNEGLMFKLLHFASALCAWVPYDSRSKQHCKHHDVQACGGVQVQLTSALERSIVGASAGVND